MGRRADLCPVADRPLHLLRREVAPTLEPRDP